MTTNRPPMSKMVRGRCVISKEWIEFSASRYYKPVTLEWVPGSHIQCVDDVTGDVLFAGVDVVEFSKAFKVWLDGRLAF